MSFEKGEEITLDDNEVYTVVDSFEMDTKKYLYLINDKKEIGLVQVEGDTLKTIEDDLEYEKVFNTLYERNKAEIEKLMETDES